MQNLFGEMITDENIGHLFVADIISDSIVDGPGLRTTVFLQGCLHKCEGCQNPQTWAFSAHNASKYTVKELYQRLMEIDGPRNVTFSGGDPAYQGRALFPLVRQLFQSGFNIWCYTGYTYEELHRGYTLESLTMRHQKSAFVQALRYMDVLVDGPFVQEKKSIDLLYKGSENQRLIDLQKSIKITGSLADKYPVVLWHEEA